METIFAQPVNGKKIFSFTGNTSNGNGVEEFTLTPPNESIPLPASTQDGIMGILIFIQSILLKIVLPVVVVGSSLYIAYELFTAEGDESKLKTAWSSIGYAVIAIFCIMLAWVVIGLISGLNIK